MNILLAEERLVAALVRAWKRLRALVHELNMRGEPQFPVESAVAVRTGEGILASVVEDVGAKLGGLNEGLKTRVLLVTHCCLKIPLTFPQNLH